MIKAEKVFDEVFSARNFNTSPLTISGLDGDTYDYEMVVFGVGISDADVDFQLRFNADSSTNYRRYYMHGVGSSKGAQVHDSRDAQILVDMRRSAYPTLSKVMITGSSGEERYLEFSATGTTNSNSIVRHSSGYWKNTADNIISINLTSDLSGSSDAHIMLYRTPKASGQSEWELMEVLDWNAETAIKSFTVDGDRDKVYKITLQSNWRGHEFRFNSDSGGNYTRQMLYNQNGAINSINTPNYSANIMEGHNGVVIINAESGVERLSIASGGSIGNIRDQAEQGIWYSNTVTNITSINMNTLGTSLTGTAKLYRKRNPDGTGDTLPFEVIETVDISGDFSAGHDFTGLLGDSVNLYKLEFLGEYGGSLNLRAQFNGDTGSNYTYQYLRGNSSTTSAATSTLTYNEFLDGQANSTNSALMYLYPKSKENRPSLNRIYSRANRLELRGNWWNNSADEITSIKVYGSNTNTITGKLILSRLV